MPRSRVCDTRSIAPETLFSRTEALIGGEALHKLRCARVAVFGVGGVGSYTAEALARAGVGSIALIDGDVVSADNINRQLPALTDTVGLAKVTVMADRIRRINPSATLETRQEFYLPQNSAGFDLAAYDWVADAVDTVAAKVELALRCAESGVPLISCMGAGNKLDPTAFQVADIYETSVCPLCRIMRRELKKRGIASLRVVYSREEPLLRSRTPASISFVPSVAGLIMAAEVVKGLIGGSTAR